MIVPLYNHLFPISPQHTIPLKPCAHARQLYTSSVSVFCQGVERQGSRWFSAGGGAVQRKGERQGETNTGGRRMAGSAKQGRQAQAAMAAAGTVVVPGRDCSCRLRCSWQASKGGQSELASSREVRLGVAAALRSAGSAPRPPGGPGRQAGRSRQVALVRLASAQRQALLSLQLDQLQSREAGGRGKQSVKQAQLWGSAMPGSSQLRLAGRVQRVRRRHTAAITAAAAAAPSHPACPSCRTRRASAAAAAPWAARCASSTGRRRASAAGCARPPPPGAGA